MSHFVDVPAAAVIQVCWSRAADTRRVAISNSDGGVGLFRIPLRWNHGKRERPRLSLLHPPSTLYGAGLGSDGPMQQAAIGFDC